MSKDFRPSVKSVSFHSNCDRVYLRLFCTNRTESSPIDSFPLFPGVQSIPSHRSLALGSSPSAIGRRGAAWSRLSSAIGRRGAAWSSVALSDQRDQRGSMQRLSTAVTDVLHSWLGCMQAQCCATAVTSAATLHWSITELCRCCGAACAMLSML